MRPRAALLASMVALLATAGPAAAHGGGAAARGMHSTIRSITPTVRGLELVVTGGDDRLRLTNATGRTVVVTGYQGEPYLRFTPSGVDENLRSPATYLNRDRFGREPLPAKATGTGAPQWHRVALGDEYEWHDHRIHWMSTILPPQIADDRGHPHHVESWTVPLTVGAQHVTVRGSLDYRPVRSSWWPWVAAVGVQALILAALVALVVRRRRRRAGRRAPEAT